MRKHINWLWLLPFVLGASIPETNIKPTSQAYNDIHVEKIHRLDSSVRIYCDLKDMPPIIGKNIPVCMKGLKPSKNPQDNLELLMFLNDLLLAKSENHNQIILKNIERGDTFCIVADIEIDSKDLCELLIHKNLVNKVIEIPSTTPQQKTETVNETQVNKSAEQIRGNYIASKSSKVFHRETCSHVKRMDKSKAVSFQTRNDAEKTGRRPCKMCKP